MAVLPMGVGWSLYFAQRIGENLMSQVPKLSSASMLNDSNASGVFSVHDHDRLSFYVYVDNLGVLGADGTRVADTLKESQDLFNSKGLRIHEVSLSSTCQEILGLLLHLEEHFTACTYGRWWRV